MKQKTMTGGEVIVEMLRRFEVEFMFGLPGDQTPIYDAIHRRGDIRHILVRHEQAAAHMADAYARATGKVGVCDAAVGPGATNLITGIAEAHASGIAVIAIVSDIRSDWRGRDSFQEIDQVGVFRPVTKSVFTVDHVLRIPEFVARAFQVATTGRPGPVLLNLPLNVLKDAAEFTPARLTVDARYGNFPAHRQSPPADDIAAAVEALRAADRPVILAGGGVIASRAAAEVRALVGALGVPVATTFMGKGALPENHPLALGPFGLLGRPPTNEYILRADFALALGTRFTNVDTAAWRIPRPGMRLIQVDIEAAQLGRNRPVERACPATSKPPCARCWTKCAAAPAPKHHRRARKSHHAWHAGDDNTASNPNSRATTMHRRCIRCKSSARCVIRCAPMMYSSAIPASIKSGAGSVLKCMRRAVRTWARAAPA